MKKVLMMTVMVAVALSAQAGYIQWQMGSANNANHFFNPYDPVQAKGVGVGSVIYAILASDQAAVETAIMNGSFLTSGLILNSHAIDNLNLSTTPSSAAAVTPNSGTIAVMLVVFSGGAGYDAEGGFYAISKSLNAAIATLSGDVTPTSFTFNNAWGKDGTAGAVAVGWTVYGIPEPATGLLALAGIGMLVAQRRRRA